MPVLPTTELELKTLRLETFDALQSAKQQDSQEAAAAARQLLIDIDMALDALALDGMASFGKRLAEIVVKLSDDTASANAWPLDGLVVPDIPTEPPVEGLDSPKPAPDGPASQFVSARLIANKTIMYIDDKGREFIREGGSKSWRNFNPGNIRKGDFAIISGAIGDDGSFAIFPNLETGQDAIVDLLRAKSYSGLSLVAAVFRYAPPHENDSATYANFLEKETGIARDTILGDMKVADIRKIAAAIQKIEGWTVGIERADLPTSHSDNGGVSSSAGAAEDWMAFAKQEAALPAKERSEWGDPGENPRILNYFKVAAPWFNPGQGDEESWCAAFVNYCLISGGYIGTNHPGARSFFWNKKKQFVKLPGPAYGAVAVRRYAPFSDPIWKEGNGHVGFVSSWTATHVELLGGNQGNSVQKRTYPLIAYGENKKVSAEFVAFMMPVIS